MNEKASSDDSNTADGLYTFCEIVPVQCEYSASVQNL